MAQGAALLVKHGVPMIEHLICKMMLRSGLSHAEVEQWVREVLATEPCEARKKLEQQDAED